MLFFSQDQKMLQNDNDLYFFFAFVMKKKTEFALPTWKLKKIRIVSCGNILGSD